MQRLLGFVAAAAVASASEVTPVQKVIQLLDNMKDKGTKEMKEEQAQFKKYKEFCDTTLTSKTRSITEATEKIEVLEGDIEHETEEIRRLKKEIAEHSAKFEKTDKEMDEATAVRKKEKSDYDLAHKDLSESIDAISRALKVMKGDQAAKKNMALIQLKSDKLIPQDALASIDDYLTDAPEAKSAALIEEEVPAPEAKSYEFQSGGIVGMLKDLEDKFTDERTTLTKEERKAEHAYSLLMQTLKAENAEADKQKTDKTDFKNQAQESKAEAEAELSETSAEKSADQKYHDDLQATCTKKTEDFDARQKLRHEEIEAIQKATDIISSNAVSGSAEKHLPTLVQTGSQAAALAFLRTESSVPTQEKVARFLQQKASSINSRVLSAAAQRVSEDPMAKVRTMMQGLIKKIQDQVMAEETHHNWCETELAANKATREEKTDNVDGLQADIDQMTSKLQKLGEDITTLSSEVSELNAAMKNASEIRLKEKNENEMTIRDAKAAQEAVAQALEVLKEFYAKAGEATAFVQTQTSSHAGQPEPPEAFGGGDEPYQGMGGETGGIMGLLDVIQSDFARVQNEAEAAEEAAAAEYTKFMDDSKMDKLEKNKAVEHKQGKKELNTKKLADLDNDIQGAHKELDAAEEYYKKLKPDCVEEHLTFAERKAQRDEELKDLESALDMLNNA